jgi:nitrogen-specific signal transduction histidine kinase
LKDRVLEGKFLEDLFYQLSTISIFVPPLRDRSKEISLIAQYILKEYSEKMKIKKVEISNNVLTLLESYWWPGNLKELEHILIQSAIFSDGNNLIERDLFFKIENLKSSFPSFLKKAEMKPPAPMEKKFSVEQQTLFLSTFLIELVHRIKNPLVSIKSFTQLLREKFDDPEFRNHFYRVMTEDIENIDSLLNSLLDFIKINNPIEKKNTIHHVLEDILRKYEHQLKDKQIRIFRKYEQGLPETIVHEEQLRYIFGSLIQYAISSIPVNGSVGFLTKSLNTHKKSEFEKTSLREDRGYIEIMIIFTGYKKQNEQFKNVLGIQAPQQEESIELELRLIKEIVQKNQGMMEFEVNEKKPRTLISLKFPMERRKVIHYPSTNN